MWHEFLVAIGLVLIIEGIMPFINPAGLRRACALITGMGDRVIRAVGLGCMLVGLVVIYVIR